ncbi:YciI family protein [Aldersonia sp. NBC_00410]|uniref:YciI family protein n=1 Tax=Aldersonia sp. NBC_00410 TaxID=2975954 RepID=UPI00225AAB78|nr:YciI family protein [Aldersonia sp. NBC_00410]MCX5045892.1 YciI family protein [Aldersonia sp. NBC_00410]
MTLHTVHYTYAEPTAAGRDEHRPAHRAWLAALLEQGIVVSAGAYADGTGALILIEGTDAEAVRNLLDADPFLVEQLVADVRINEWRPAMGAFAD